MGIFIWAGIIFCVSQLAMFSGLNLACFGVSRLRLEVEKANGNKAAEKVLQLREDSHFLLVTIATRTDDGAIDKDIVLVWGKKKKIVTGADILGRLLKGVLAPTDLR